MHRMHSMLWKCTACTGSSAQGAVHAKSAHRHVQLKWLQAFGDGLIEQLNRLMIELCIAGAAAFLYKPTGSNDVGCC